MCSRQAMQFYVLLAASAGQFTNPMQYAYSVQYARSSRSASNGAFTAISTEGACGLLVLEQVDMCIQCCIQLVPVTHVEAVWLIGGQCRLGVKLAQEVQILYSLSNDSGSAWLYKCPAVAVHMQAIYYCL